MPLTKYQKIKADVYWTADFPTSQKTSVCCNKSCTLYNYMAEGQPCTAILCDKCGGNANGEAD